MSLDELAYRGVIYHAGSPSENALRVLALANAVCRRLEPAVAGGGDEPVVTIFAYLTYFAPPIQSPAPTATLPADPDERCHPYLLPFMTGVRDTIEYDPARVAADPPATGPVGALRRAQRQPDRFTWERWAAAGARRLGLYEYLYSASFVVPRVYTARLRAAVTYGERFRMRAFVSETLPTWGLDGPMYWECARILWRPALGALEVRQDYCRRAFGAAWEKMAQYLAVCEEAWASTRDEHRVFTAAAPAGVLYPDRRTNSVSGAGYYGHGFGGRGVFLSQLDGWYRSSSTDPMQRSRLIHAWVLLNEALLVPELDADSRQRVRLLRQTFGFTLLIALWYEPLHRAFERIRAMHRDVGTMQYPGGLFGQDVEVEHPGIAAASNVFFGQYIRVASGGPAEVDGVKPRVDFTRSRELAEVSAFDLASDLALRRAVANCIGTADAPGIRALRQEVHQYLALSGLEDIRSLTARQGELENVGDLGLGLFPGAAVGEPRSGPLPLPASGTIEGPHRLVGLYLPSVIEYVDWWNNVTTRGGVARDEDAQLVLVREPEAGIGWIFNAIKEMAAVVVLYTTGLTTATISLADRKNAVLNG